MRALVVIALLGSVSHARAEQATTDERSILLQEQFQAMMTDPSFQKQARHLAKPLEAMMAEAEQLQVALSDPSFQKEAKRVIEPLKALITDPKFQKQGERVVEEMKALMVDPAFQKEFQRIAKPLMAVIARPDAREAERILDQMQVVMADPKFQKQAERASEPLLEMMSSEELQEKVKSTIEELDVVVADPKFQLEATRIAEPVMAMMAGAQQFGEVFADPSFQQEAERMAGQIEGLIKSPASSKKSLASVLLAGTPASIARRTPTQRRVVMDEGEKLKGAVKWFDTEKGFGFIERGDGEGDVFVHQTEIYAEGFRSLAEGEEVEFTMKEGSNGKMAAADVTGPDGAYVQGAPRPPRDNSFDDDEVSEDGW